MKLIFREDDEYRHDVERIVRVCSERGYDVSYHDAKKAWERHSENYAAGWLMQPEHDESLFQEVRSQLSQAEDQS